MKNILILGAGLNTGLAVARLYCRLGYRVILAARRRDVLDRLKAALADEVGETVEIELDMTDLANLRQTLSLIIARFGQIDSLYVSPSTRAGFTSAAELTAARASAHVDLFLLPLIEAVRAVLPGMSAARAGEIVYINAAGALGAPARMSGAAPSLAAARNYLKTLRAEVEPAGIRVRAVFVAAPIVSHPLRDGEAGDWSAAGDLLTIQPGAVAHAAHTLLADEAAFETVVPRR